MASREEIHQKTRRLEILRKEKFQLLSSLAFLQHCRDSDTIPICVKVTHHIQSPAAKRILHRTSLALLRECIKSTRYSLHCCTVELYSLRLELSRTLRPEDWNHIDRITNESASRTFSLSTSKQKKKFQHLHERQHPQPPNNKEKLICNLAGIQLSDAATSVLAKGLNFAFLPRHIPMEDIITGVEVALWKLPLQEAEEIRQYVANVLTKSKPPRPNLPLDQRRALDDLKSNRDIIILGADKGNSMVIINRKDYQAKIKSLLEDTTYEKLKKDLTAKIEREVRDLIKRSSISNEEQFHLLPLSARRPRLYRLPKIHKEGVPLRPIVSCIGSPTYALARYLANHLQPFIGQTGSCMKNSKEFIEVLKQLRISDNDILVSFDAVSLFTKVPIMESVDIIKRLTKVGLLMDFPKLADFYLRSTYFLWDREFYQQKDGAAMGSPLSPVVANLYMEHFEEDALASSKLRPSCQIRYVDDTFVIWPHGKETLKEFADHLNSIHPSIQFAMEIEMNGELPFLDVLVQRGMNGSLRHTAYRKATHTDRYLHAHSHHHPQQKSSVHILQGFHSPFGSP
ncbi:uncharacterized protein LOC124153288 [Ischnura elegans]|uniref:uncharacterized protein LOC124153288 n=1 Tax=Ischnura elegans TaxID=197161 RepID=UPI001ED8B8AC|nr:uncharacterized protein LOC124153288 [Ischnura elegans]